MSQESFRRTDDSISSGTSALKNAPFCKESLKPRYAMVQFSLSRSRQRIVVNPFGIGSPHHSASPSPYQALHFSLSIMDKRIPIGLRLDSAFF
jgi:hypothetical protein